ncbi:MAG: hypothetical protein U9Q82_01140 [Chloroflexota bacterium]|nr:hypothetical protein [Chloroflexota bacterium]
MIELDFPQLMMFDTDEPTAGTADLWQALEQIASPETSQRYQGLDILLELEVPTRSPLVAYVLATRLTDPDINFRASVIKTLGKIIAPASGEPISLPARRYLKGYHSIVGRGTVLATLEVAEIDASVESYIAALYRLWPHTGAILAAIMAKHGVSVSLRRQALNFIGRVGFVETIPQLERLAERLSSRSNGQKRMSFAPPAEHDETTLLPTVQATLTVLREI